MARKNPRYHAIAAIGEEVRALAPVLDRLESEHAVIHAVIERVDRAGRLPLNRIGRWEYEVTAWRDLFGSWRSELSKKIAAGLDVFRRHDGHGTGV